MEYTEGKIAVSEIDQRGEPFRITTAPVDETLIRSIERLGLLNRPLLIPRNGRFTIVCGFRRIAALEALGEKMIRARLLPESTPDQRCLEIAIAENGAERPLNVIEMARGIHGLSLFCRPEERDAAIWEAFNLKSNAGMLKKLRAIQSFPEWVKKSILHGNLDFAVASDLVGSDHNDLSALILYFDRLHLSLSKQREFLTLVKEISRREMISIRDILDDKALKDLLEDPEMEGNQKGSQIRSLLKKRRRPILIRAEERYAGIVKTLKLGPDKSLIPPRDFEGSLFSLSLRFNTIHELAEKVQEVEEMLKNPVFDELISKRFYME